MNDRLGQTANSIFRLFREPCMQVNKVKIWNQINLHSGLIY
jgi:hypothetical protein